MNKTKLKKTSYFIYGLCIRWILKINKMHLLTDLNKSINPTSQHWQAPKWKGGIHTQQNFYKCTLQALAKLFTYIWAYNLKSLKKFGNEQ